MFYATEAIPLPWRYLYALNPVVGVVEGMRWTLLNPSYEAPLLLMLISTISALVILLSGLYVFQRREPSVGGCDLMGNLAIESRQLSKRFVSRGHGRALHMQVERTMRSVIPRSNGRKGHGEDRWALRDVSFQVERGECIALIGHNGAGKSVLLRLLSRVTRPTSGEAFLYGRVGAVLDVGVRGFNHDLTGLENIFLQETPILGIQKRGPGDQIGCDYWNCRG